MTRTKSKEIKTAHIDSKYGLHYLATKSVVITQEKALEQAKILFSSFMKNNRNVSDHFISEYVKRLNKFYFSGIKFDLQDLQD